MTDLKSRIIDALEPYTIDSGRRDEFDRAVNDVMAAIEKRYQQLQQENTALREENKEIGDNLFEAMCRIDDLLIQDDGQAYKEARRFMEKMEGEE